MSVITPLLTNPDALTDSVEAWLHQDGGQSLSRALQAPDEALATIAEADLRGMGGAGFPTAEKWRAALEAGGGGWVVVNGNEDEPGTFKDRWLLANTPYTVLEGALIAAVVTRARHIVMYVNRAHPDVLAAVGRAVASVRESAPLARLAAALGHVLELHITESSGHYVGGEDTAVVATVEGRFPFPRKKPPYPTRDGVHGQPTVVNNVETLALVPHVIRHGAAFHRARGRGGASGSKLFCLSGDVLRPGLYELPMGITLRELVFDHGGGMLDGRSFKAAFTGGPSNTLLAASDLDAPLDFDSLSHCSARPARRPAAEAAVTRRAAVVATFPGVREALRAEPKQDPLGTALSARSAAAR